MADESIRVPIDGDTSGFDQKVEGMKGTISAASVAMGNLLSDMGKKALSAFGDMISSGDEFNKAINQMSSSTGATGAELEGLRDVVKDVYGNNFGDSYEDAANAVAEVTKQTGLMGEELQSATEGAMALSDTFGYEVNESTRAASALMNNFGISAEEAYNLIAAGAQNGADQNGDLLDTLNEYSTQYAALGLSAEQFTQSLISGAESGAFSIDKVGDAVKEFNIRCKDGSESTAEGFAMIGMNADDMAQRLAAIRHRKRFSRLSRRWTALPIRWRKTKLPLTCSAHSSRTYRRTCYLCWQTWKMRPVWRMMHWDRSTRSSMMTSAVR